MAVITISRDFGSGGTWIAQQTAKKLGYRLADKHTIGTLLSKYGLIEFETVYDTVPAFWDGFNAQRMDQRKETIEMMNRTILALAQHENVVILGRGSYLILGGFNDVLNVRVHAPAEFRISRVMETQNIRDRDEAAALVEKHDNIRQQFIESTYRVRGELARDFDLVINTGKIPRETAARLIVHEGKVLAHQKGSEIRKASTLAVDRILADAVSEVLAAQ